MKINLTQDKVSFETQVLFSDFKYLVDLHLYKVPGTKDIESLGKEAIRQNFAPLILEEFIKKICVWGGGKRILGKILSPDRDFSDIRDQFCEANRLLYSETYDVVGALNSINKITGLGQPSFASKMLRFMRPSICPILDSKVNLLGYAGNVQGYKKYSLDCLAIASKLQEMGIANPMQRADNKWFASDVDMAIFAYLNNWKLE